MDAGAWDWGIIGLLKSHSYFDCQFAANDDLANIRRDKLGAALALFVAGKDDCLAEEKRALEQAGLPDGVDVGHGFIEQQYALAGGQYGRESDELTLATGKIDAAGTDQGFVPHWEG